MPAPTESRTTAVLVSGGLDSAVLLGDALDRADAVFPLYVRCGLVWEESELAALERFLAALAGSALRPLHILRMPVSDLYGRHWALTGEGIPGAASADEAVYLPGRNVLLLVKALLWCRLNGVPRVELATLDGNPFPDTTPDFFAAFAAAVHIAVGGPLEILSPFAGMSKAEVLRRGRDLPLQWTLSCLKPAGGRHCGRCNKCAERRRAFAQAGLRDLAARWEDDSCTA